MVTPKGVSLRKFSHSSSGRITHQDTIRKPPRGTYAKAWSNDPDWMAVNIANSFSMNSLREDILPYDGHGKFYQEEMSGDMTTLLAVIPLEIDASKDFPLADGEESLRHREAAAVTDGLARGLLWKISDCTFIPGPEVVGFVDDYDGLRAVLRVVRAGWATAGPRGLYVTERGRDVASQLFVDR